MSTTEPVPNLPLLRAVLAQIDAAPERWNQRDWASRGECGTAYCVAGWAVHIAYPDTEPDWREGACGCERCRGKGFTASASFVKGKDLSIERLAEEKLGLTYIESGRLFAASNTRDDIQHYAEQIAARAGESL